MYATLKKLMFSLQSTKVSKEVLKSRNCLRHLVEKKKIPTRAKSRLWWVDIRTQRIISREIMHYAALPRLTKARPPIGVFISCNSDSELSSCKMAEAPQPDISVTHSTTTGSAPGDGKRHEQRSHSTGQPCHKPGGASKHYVRIFPCFSHVHLLTVKAGPQSVL